MWSSLVFFIQTFHVIRKVSRTIDVKKGISSEKGVLKSSTSLLTPVKVEGKSGNVTEFRLSPGCNFQDYTMLM